MRPGRIALTPAFVTLLAVLAFLAVLNFAITPTNSNESTNNVNLANGNANVVNSNTSVNTNAVVNTNSENDQTAGWQTYTNTEYSFSLKYPADLRVLVNQEIEGEPLLRDSVHVLRGPEDDGESYVLSICPQGTCVPFQDGVWDSKESAVMVGGKSAIKQVWTFSESKTGSVCPTCAQRVTFRFDPVIPGWTNGNNILYSQSDEQLAQSLLSTLTFTDPTAGWKTYQHASLGYSVKYPASWKVSSCDGTDTRYFGAQGVICGSDAGTEDFLISRSNQQSSQQHQAQYRNMIDNPLETAVTIAGQSGTRIQGITRVDSDAFGGGDDYIDYIWFVREGVHFTVGYTISTGDVKYQNEFESFYRTLTFTQ